jgi:hypothetical protein
MSESGVAALLNCHAGDYQITKSREPTATHSPTYTR